MPGSSCHHQSVAARGWRGLHGLLALLLMAGLFWCALQAQAASLSGADEGEMAHWVLADLGVEDIEPTEPALAPSRDLICRKPVPYKPGTDLVLNEIADQDVPSCLVLWPSLPQAVPASEPQPEFPQAERQPLLRPPARLG